MAHIKLFLTVFIAVLLGNISTALILRAYGDAPKWVQGFTFMPNHSTTQSPNDTKTLNNGPVTFKNAANKRLNCWIQKDGNYVSLLNLNRDEEKTIQDFVLGSNVRCNIQLDSRSSTTLTYFQPTISGTYQFQLEKVPCSSCKGQDWRWATAYIDPNGKSDYTHWQ